ncbi:MAG: Rrf2 family transcriptional regulator, partial [Chlorobi bacterium]|nr:Rrf2 family transcriptional regulator [Chlorobiota bacterium]
MRFSKTTEYSLRILSYMAIENKLYTAEMLKDNLEIPYRYLRKQLTKLVKDGFLVSVKGKSGGYKIAKSLKDISLLDIVGSTDDIRTHNICFFGFDNCVFGEK